MRLALLLGFPSRRRMLEQMAPEDYAEWETFAAGERTYKLNLAAEKPPKAPLNWWD